VALRAAPRPAQRWPDAALDPYHGRTKNTAIALIAFERHFDPLGEHVRFFTRRSLAALLTEFGFEQISLRTIGGVALLRETLLAEATRARPAFVR